MTLNVGLVFGMFLAVRQGYTGEDEEAAENLRQGERFAEQDRGHGRGQGALY